MVTSLAIRRRSAALYYYIRRREVFSRRIVLSLYQNFMSFCNNQANILYTAIFWTLGNLVLKCSSSSHTPLTNFKEILSYVLYRKCVFIHMMVLINPWMYSRCHLDHAFWYAKVSLCNHSVARLILQCIRILSPENFVGDQNLFFFLTAFYIGKWTII